MKNKFVLVPFDVYRQQKLKVEESKSLEHKLQELESEEPKCAKKAEKSQSESATSGELVNLENRSTPQTKAIVEANEGVKNHNSETLHPEGGNSQDQKVSKRQKTFKNSKEKGSSNKQKSAAKKSAKVPGKLDIQQPKDVKTTLETEIFLQKDLENTSQTENILQTEGEGLRKKVVKRVHKNLKSRDKTGDLLGKRWIFI